MKKIPLSEPYIGFSEAFAAWKAVRTGWLTQNGEQVKLMESNIAKAINLQDSTFEIAAISNGTHALHLALLSLDVGPGDLVGIPDFCYVAVANAVLYCGAKPVLFDVEIETTNISLTKVSQKRLKSLKAIIVVDNYGVKNNLQKLRTIIGPRIPIIYDIAESFPECGIDENVIHQVDVISGSFYANKVFTAGEGGFVASNSTRMTKIRKLKNQGQTQVGEFKHDVLGFNYRITNVQAAIFNAQWNKRNRILSKRRRVFRQYNREISGHSQIQFINVNANPWLVAFRILRSGEVVENLRENLRVAGVETRPGFQSFHKVQYISNCSMIDNELGNSALLSNQIICLPTYPQLQKQQIEYICQILVESLNAT